MNDRQRIRLAKVIGVRAELLAKALDTVTDNSTVMARMRDAQGGIRARAFDGATKTMRHDSTFAGIGKDQAVVDERNLDAALTAAAKATNHAWEIIGRYPPPHRATDADRLALGRNKASDEPGCEQCALTTSPAGGPRWEPPRSGQSQPTFVGGRLENPMLLCEWCYSCVRRWGRLPSTTELDKHHRGEIVPWPNDVRRP